MASWISILSLSGAVAAAWMFFGVIFVARMTPGYSHTRDVMSALGARGSSAAKIHPFINNYPVGILFSIFSIYLFSLHGGSRIIVTGILILLHGISHIIAGIFPCDENMAASKPSATQHVHMLSGLVIQITLLAAAMMWTFPSAAAPLWFRCLSAASLIFSVIFLISMVKAFSTNHNVGLYQRISIGILILWVAIFSGLFHAAHS